MRSPLGLVLADINYVVILLGPGGVIFFFFLSFAGSHAMPCWGRAMMGNGPDAGAQERAMMSIHARSMNPA
jgi:hypothetical protein